MVNDNIEAQLHDLRTSLEQRLSRVRDDLARLIQLQHAIERAVIMTESLTLQPSDFLLSSDDNRHTENIEFPNYQIEEAEKLLIIKAIGKHNGNITKAAKDLGLTRASLYRRLEKYGL